MENNNIYPYRLIEQKEQSNNLAIILPGAGYTTQAPLLHFTTGLFFTKGYDVLHINYSFNREEMAALSEKDFTKNVQSTIDKALKNKEYRNYFIVAKSIGTIALSYLQPNTKFEISNLIWLTPLIQRDDVFNAMLNSNNKGLCIIGDKDPCFIKGRFERLKSNYHLQIKLIEGTNHSLELDGKPIESIEIVKSVISTINDF